MVTERVAQTSPVESRAPRSPEARLMISTGDLRDYQGDYTTAYFPTEAGARLSS